MSEPARATPAIGDALSEARRKTQRPQPRPGPTGMLGLQRLAGNAAVNALMAAKTKAPGEEATGKIDSALTEMRGSDPVIATVEAGLKAAEAAGVPVQLEGPKPPASALAVTTTGFGPEAVAPPRPARPPKPVAPGNALGKASAKAGGAAHGGASRGGGAAGPAAASPGAVASAGATALSSDQLNQPPVPPSHIAPEHDPAFQQVAGGVKRVAADKRAHPPAASQAQQAQGAALAPSDDAAGQAKAAKVDTMDSQQAGSFDKKAFIAAVKAAIEAKSPKNLKEAETARRAKPIRSRARSKALSARANRTRRKTSRALPRPRRTRPRRSPNLSLR